MKKHGLKHHPHYKRWVSMVNRCDNPNYAPYKDYGARGIVVCDEWSRSAGPENFCVWADRTFPFGTGNNLDRRDNDRGYSPDNCRWVSVTMNNRNMRAPKKLSALPTGVQKTPKGNFQVHIRLGEKVRYMGTFSTPEKAGRHFVLLRALWRAMKPTPEQLKYCLSMLQRFIPTPPPPKVKLQKSKWGAKVGDALISPAGERFTVDQADSGGLTLGTPDGKCARLESAAELARYEKVPKRRARKVSQGSPDSEGRRDRDGVGDSVPEQLPLC